MPSADNITRPITLIAQGRSGTSLTQSILRSHPDVEVCGETVKLLFGVWNAADQMRGKIKRDRSEQAMKEHRLRCGRTVRAAYLAMFPDTGKPQWFQKPIGLPEMLQLRDTGPVETDDAIAWCWGVLRTSFPDSRNITILRHPYDVVLSAAEFWDRSHAEGWKIIVDTARIINHPSSNVDFALSHRRMVEKPRPEIKRLLEHLGLEANRRCFKATQKVYVARPRSGHIPKQQMPDRVERSFSRKRDWSEIDMTTFTDDDREILVAMWARFGETLEF